MPVAVIYDDQLSQLPRSLALLTDIQLYGTFIVYDLIKPDMLCTACHYYLARRLRQAFFMEIFL